MADKLFLCINIFLMDTLFTPRQFSLNIKGQIYELDSPKVMGILNMTPDSFSDGGKFNTEEKALRHAAQMVREGADIIDIGPQSTRPGSKIISASEEIQRSGKIISKIKAEFPQILISLDTFYAETVRFGLDEGIDLVNDISAGQFDEAMFETVAAAKLPYILMNANESYQRMQHKNEYGDILLNVNRFLSEKTEQLKSMGVQDIILDPGFGFGKTVEDQYRLLDEAEHIGLREFPVLIGISRKSFIYKTLGKAADEVGEETALLHRKVLEKGAKILRVHDVAAAKKTIQDYLYDRQ